MRDNSTIKRKIVCKDTGEVVFSYQDYLQTTHWRKLRRLIATMANYRCESCHKYINTGYNIHHLTYTRLGCEIPEDLSFLCPDCHNAIHAAQKKKVVKPLPRNSLYVQLKKQSDIKRQVKMVMRSNTTVKQLFIKHFKLFMKDLKEMEQNS